MLKVKAGDIDKMALLFERYHRQLYGFLFHMSYEKEASEDLVQQVFYKMLKYRHTFTGNGEFVQWMYTIARNLLKDQSRKKVRTMFVDHTVELAEKLSDGTSLEEQLYKKQAKAQLAYAMEKLSAEQREVLILCRFQELRHAEIGHIMGLSEGAVKLRVHRALQELKEVFKKINSEDGL